jgi:L-threonylcarbamoyladenylate synthase
MKQQIEIYNSLVCLNNKKVILYPTDTVWGIGCDGTNNASVSKIYKIKNRSESKSLVILVSSMNMLQKYVRVTISLKNLINTSKEPTTIIYQNPKGLASNVIASDNSVAIRIVQDDFCRKLIKKFGKPIVSTSANVSGNNTPTSFKEIEHGILDSVDYVGNLHQNRIN